MDKDKVIEFLLNELMEAKADIETYQTMWRRQNEELTALKAQQVKAIEEDDF